MTDLFVDTATTGMWRWRDPHDDERQPHLIRLAWAIDGGVHSLLVRPRDGWEMAEDAQEKHKISLDECTTDGWSLDQVLMQFVRDLCGADRVVAYNWDFHRRIIDRAVDEIGGLPAIDWPEHACAMRQSVQLVKKPAHGRGGYAFPKFGEAFMYFANGRELPDSPDPIIRGEMLVDSLALIWRGIQAER